MVAAAAVEATSSPGQQIWRTVQAAAPLLCPQAASESAAEQLTGAAVLPPSRRDSAGAAWCVRVATSIPFRLHNCTSASTHHLCCLMAPVLAAVPDSRRPAAALPLAVTLRSQHPMLHVLHHLHSLRRLRTPTFILPLLYAYAASCGAAGSQSRDLRVHYTTAPSHGSHGASAR